MIEFTGIVTDGVLKIRNRKQFDEQLKLLRGEVEIIVRDCFRLIHSRTKRAANNMTEKALAFVVLKAINSCQLRYIYRGNN